MIFQNLTNGFYWSRLGLLLDAPLFYVGTLTDYLNYIIVNKHSAELAIYSFMYLNSGLYIKLLFFFFFYYLHTKSLWESNPSNIMSWYKVHNNYANIWSNSNISTKNNYIFSLTSKCPLHIGFWCVISPFHKCDPINSY